MDLEMSSTSFDSTLRVSRRSQRPRHVCTFASRLCWAENREEEGVTDALDGKRLPPTTRGCDTKFVPLSRQTYTHTHIPFRCWGAAHKPAEKASSARGGRPWTWEGAESDFPPGVAPSAPSGCLRGGGAVSVCEGGDSGDGLRANARPAPSSLGSLSREFRATESSRRHRSSHRASGRRRMALSSRYSSWGPPPSGETQARGMRPWCSHVPHAQSVRPGEWRGGGGGQRPHRQLAPGQHRLGDAGKEISLQSYAAHLSQTR